MKEKRIKLPVASALLSVVLVILIFLIPKWDSQHQSKTSRLLRGADPNTHVDLLANRSKPIVLRKSATGWSCSDPNSVSWDEATRIADGFVPDAVVAVYNMPLQVDSGVLSLTRREVIETLVVWPNPDPQSEKQLRKLALEQFVKMGYSPEIVTRLAEGNIYSVTPLYNGYWFNGLFLLLSILLLWSLSWVLLIPSWIQIAKAQALLDRGQCPFCRYSLQDLKSEKCPECGMTFPKVRKSADVPDY